MFKLNLFLFCLTTCYFVSLNFCFLNVPSIENFDRIEFDESIFKAYNSSSMITKTVKSSPIPSKIIKGDIGVEASSGSRDIRMLKPETNKHSKKINPLEKLLGVAMTGGTFEDARKLVRLKCSNSMIRSYLQIDEEYPSYTHPRISDFEMVNICENNKTSCCNKQETLEIQSIFKKRQNIIRELLKKFRKIVYKLGIYLLIHNNNNKIN